MILYFLSASGFQTLLGYEVQKIEKLSLVLVSISFFLSLFPFPPVAIGWRLVGDSLVSLLAIASWYLSQLFNSITLKLLVVLMAISLVDTSLSSDVLI